MKLRDMRKADVQGKRVLVSVDYNVALERGKPRDLTRLEATRLTISWLRRHGATVLLVTHRGRPTKRDPAWSLQPIVPALSQILGTNVRWLPDPVGSPALRAAAQSLKSGNVALLENIRFYPGEAKNSPVFAKKLASLADVWVMDAFANAHRAHASTAGVGAFLPGYAGLLVQDEVLHLSKLLGPVARPYVAVLGGAKISTKLGLIKSFLKKADVVLLGGALANTVLDAEGLNIGASVSEPGMAKLAKGLSVSHAKLKIPVDVVTARNASAKQCHICPVGGVAENDMILDIGPDTATLFSTIISRAATVVWNGPMGLYETPPYDAGTRALARVVAKGKGYRVVGGGETVDAVKRQHLANRISFVSTGGGAMLEFLEGKQLPGLAAVKQH